MSDDRVQFLGAGPYALPTLQGAMINTLGESLEILLYATIHGRPGVMQMKVPHDVAEQFSIDLSDALADLTKAKK